MGIVSNRFEEAATAVTAAAEEVVKFKRRQINTIVNVIDNGSNEFTAVPYVAEVWSKSTEDDDGIGFGKSTESESQFYVIRDVEGAVVDKEILTSIFGGLDAPHSSVKAKMIDYISDKAGSDKQKSEILELLSRSIGSIKKELIYPIDDKSFIINELESDLPAASLEKVTKELNRLGKLLGGSNASSEGSGIGDDKLSCYSFNKHIMLVGSAGSGKTRKLSGYVYDSLKDGSIDNYIEMDGHEGIESVDMLGMQVPNSEGTLTWIDGPVTEAFRYAASGKKTILFMDEILRIPQRELSILVGSLTVKADGNYHLRTGRVEEVDPITNIGRTEEIIVKPEFLWVMAASNIGSGFAVDDMDTAFKDRFRTFRVDTSEEIVKYICANAAKDGSISDSEASQLVTSWKDFQDIKAAGNLQKVFSARHVAESISLVTNGLTLYEALQDLSYTVLSVNSTGLVNKAEAEIWEKLTEMFE